MRFANNGCTYKPRNSLIVNRVQPWITETYRRDGKVRAETVILDSKVEEKSDTTPRDHELSGQPLHVPTLDNVVLTVVQR